MELFLKSKQEESSDLKLLKTKGWASELCSSSAEM